MPIRSIHQPCALSAALFAAVLSCMSAGFALAQEDIGATHRRHDASADRGIFFNRAETIGEGKTTFNAYELVFVGVTHAWSNNAQATANFLMPITKDFPLFIVSNVKYVVSRTQNATVALQGELSVQKQGDISGGAFGAAAMLDFHVSPQFSLHGQIGLNTIWANDDDDPVDEEAFNLDFGLSPGNVGIFRIVGGASFRASANFHIHSEVVIPGGYADDEFRLLEEATLIFYGVRFAGTGLSADLGFVRPLVEDPGPLQTGIPWVSFAARF